MDAEDLLKLLQTPIPFAQWGEFFWRNEIDSTEFIRVVAVHPSAPSWNMDHPPHQDGKESWYRKSGGISDSFLYERDRGGLKADHQPPSDAGWTFRGRDSVDGSMGWAGLIPGSYTIWLVDKLTKGGQTNTSPIAARFGVSFEQFDGTNRVVWFRRTLTGFATPFMQGSSQNPAPFEPGNGDRVTFVKATVLVTANSWEHRSRTLA